MIIVDPRPLECLPCQHNTTKLLYVIWSVMKDEVGVYPAQSAYLFSFEFFVAYMGFNIVECDLNICYRSIWGAGHGTILWICLFGFVVLWATSH